MQLADCSVGEKILVGQAIVVCSNFSLWQLFLTEESKFLGDYLTSACISALSLQFLLQERGSLRDWGLYVR